MVNTVKFSDFDSADINDASTETVGLSSGVNTRENKFYTWTTLTRPATPFNGLLGLNTTLEQYEYWDSVISAWTQLTTDINILALLASHAVNQGASLIGLQNQSHVSNKFVQDLANAKFIAQTDNGTLQNGQFLGSLTTGIVKNTTTTGVLSISAPLTSIDGLTTNANQMLYTTGANTYATTTLTPFSRGLFSDADAAAWRASLGVTPGGGTVTSISAGTGITLSPDPIVTTGSVSLTVPVLPTLGGTGLITYVLGDTIYSSAADTLSRLVGNTTITKKFYSQTGDGVNSAAPVWSTISASDVSSPAALTKTNDTNVTLTLGGSPTVALLAATSLTLGWTGTLSPTRGGLGLSDPTAHGILVGEGSSAVTPIVLSSGQILIGSTGIDPIAAAINSGTGVLVANGAGSITVSLANANNNTIKSNISGILAAPVDNTLTAIIDSAIGNTQGDILYRNATAWVALPPSTSGFALVTQGAASNPIWASVGGSFTPSALTKADDTNVTLALGGTPGTALLQATSLTLGWTGQLAVSRGGTGNNTFTAYSVICAGTTATGAFQNVVGVGTSGQVLQSNGAAALPSWATIPGATSAALTKTDDTNVTLTLGGAPTTALLTATSLTLGWTGQLGLTRGGTAASLTASNGGIVYSTASALAILAGTATAGLALLSGASTTPTWSTNPPITQINVQRFLATGTYTPTTGMKYCIIEVAGSGGGGGGRASSAGSNAGGGGGAGGYSKHLATAADIGVSQSVTIGAAGGGGAAGANAGSAGSDCSLGTLAVGKGGSGGATGVAGSQCAGGAGGVPGTGNILTIAGSNGDAGFGTSISTVTLTGGAGGISFFGGGAGSTQSTTNGAAAGANTGSGGSGGVAFSLSGNVAGGAGGTGVVIITEFISK